MHKNEPISDLSRWSLWRLPWLIIPLWRQPKTLWPVSSDPLLVRITSSDIRASALVTGSIPSNFYFFPLSFVSQFRVCILFHSCYILFRSCLRLCWVLVCILLHSCLRFCLCSCFHSYSCSCSCFFHILCQKIMFEFCYKFCLGTIWLTRRILGI